MAVLNHTAHDYLNISSPIKYDQGFKYDDSRIKYDGSLDSDSLDDKEIGLGRSETLGITDAGFTRAWAAIRTATDTLTIGDSMEVVRTFLRSFTDTLGIIDSGETKVVGQLLSDTLGITDAGFTKVWAIVRSESDILTITEVNAKTVSFPESDNLSITDSGETKTVGMPQVDTLSITDAGETKVVGLVQVDILSVSDTFTKVVSYKRSPTDVLSLADSLAKGIGLPRADTLTIADAVSMAIIFARNFTETLGVTDSVAKEVSVPLSDVLNITDAGEVKIVGLVQVDIFGITDAGYTYYVPDKGPAIFISKEDIRTAVGGDIPKVKIIGTTATTTSGIRPSYDSSLKYDTSGLYYDKWYSESGDLTQGERPKITVTEKNVKINISDDKATIKKVSK